MTDQQLKRAALKENKNLLVSGIFIFFFIYDLNLDESRWRLGSELDYGSEDHKELPEKGWQQRTFDGWVEIMAQFI